MPENLYTRNGVYYARIQISGRELRQSLRTSNRAEAGKRLKAMLAEVSPYHGTIDQRFDAVMSAYLTDMVTVAKPKTAARYTQSSLILTDHFGGRWWHSITKQSVLEYIEARKADGIKIPTIKRDLTVLSQAAEYAIEKRWGAVNPVLQIGKRTLRHKSPIFKRPDDEAVKTMIDSLYGNLRPLAAFLLATGMRRDEGVYLDRSHVNMKRRTATLPDTKSGTTRTVDLSDEAIAILEAQPHHIGTKLFFPTRDGNPYKQASTNWGETQRKVSAKAEDFPKFSLHGLRHLYAIEYLERGGNLYTLQKQLGHGSIRQTEWYLQFLSPSEQAKAKNESAQIPAQPHRFALVDGSGNG